MSNDGVNLTGVAQTTVSPPHPRPSTVVGPVAAPEVKAMDDANGDHTRAFRRFFIGPMPETVAVPRKKGLWRSRSRERDEDDEDGAEDESLLDRLGADHIRDFFLKNGGRPEQWGEEQERSVRRELLRRWNESGWAGVRKKDQLSRNNWTGKTFEVGDFLGMNLMLDEAAESARPSMSRASSSRTTQSSRTEHTIRVEPPSLRTERSTTTASFVTANSVLPPPTIERLTPSPSPTDPSASHEGFASTSALPLVRTESPSSLLPTPNGANVEAAKSDGALHLRPAPLAPTRSALKRFVDGATPSTIRKSVQFFDGDPGPSRPANLPPVSPGEVLARDPHELEGTSEGAVAAQQAEMAEDAQHHGDIILRDRMLVRVAYTKVEGLVQFDESAARTQKDTEQEDWAEFMVVWRKLVSPRGTERKDRLELYEEYSTPGKEWIVGHKDLSFIVPLRDSHTHMSLFSATDMSFSLICTPRPVHMLTRRRALFASRSSGTNLFIFKSKSRSRATDWMWQLWRHLGGSLPQFVDIRAPALGTRVRMDVPNIDDPTEQPSVDDIIDICRDSFLSLPEWHFLLEDALKKGQKLALCWRSNLKIDWVWLPEDIDGNPRPWAVWYGLALRHPNTPGTLELRLAQHFSTKIVLKDRTLIEPPAVEGYAHLVRPNGTRSRTYLSSHDGNLYSLAFARASPPAAPAPPVIVDGAPRSAVSRESEVRRGAEQILQADSFLDMRSIVRVRRAETASVQAKHDIVASVSAQSNVNLMVQGEDTGAAQEVERDESDEEDTGGEEGLTGANNTAAKTHVRLRRCFELCLRSGQVLRYEAHSRRDAVEWVTRLSELVVYWTQRHRIDARQEMELVQAVSGRPRYVLPRDRREDLPEVVPDPDDASPFLGSFWHWCVLDGCRSIIKSGRLYVKHGLKGQYTYANMALVSGHIAQYNIVPHKNEQHPRWHTVNLLDAYVCSGYMAMQALPRREIDDDGNGNPKPKRYQDGLEAGDSDEDTTFILWYHPLPSSTTGGDREVVANKVADTTVPKLNAKRKILVFKARSKLERDAWCWAINCELERVVRANREREQRVREAGGLIDTATW